MLRNVLIVAPHPDDEVLGCGGIIRKLSSRGTSVFILIVTRGKKELYSQERVNVVRQEALAAHKILGVTQTIFLDYPAPDLDLISIAELSTAILNVIVKYNVCTIFLPHRGDIHHDHKAVYNAGLVASRPNSTGSIERIYSYETLSETEWAAPFSDDAFIPDYFINISDMFVEKLKAMKCYKSQLREFPSPRSLKALAALANYRGSTVGFRFAEAFMTVRVIEA